MVNIIFVIIVLILIAGATVAGIYFGAPELLGLKKECNYTGEFGEWGECDQEGNTMRTRPFEGEELAHCQYTEKMPCNEVDCVYGEWISGSEDQQGNIPKSRSLISGPSKVCTATSKIEGCVYGDWIPGSEDAQGKVTASRTLLSGSIDKCISTSMTDTCAYGAWIPGSEDAEGNILKTRTLSSGSAELCKNLSASEKCTYEGELVAYQPPGSPSLTNVKTLISGPADLCKKGIYNILELDVQTVHYLLRDSRSKFNIEFLRSTGVRNIGNIIFNNGPGKYYFYNQGNVDTVRFYIAQNNLGNGSYITFNDVKYNGKSIVKASKSVFQYAPYDMKV